MNEENVKNAVNMTMEEFAENVKEMPSYAIYRRAVMEKRKDTAKLLQLSTMLHGLTDHTFDLAMMSVACDLLFSMLDARFQNEIIMENNMGGRVIDGRINRYNHARAVRGIA